MLDIRKLVNESVKAALLNEGLSSILYHFTSLSNVFGICSEDTIYLQSAYGKDSDNYDKKRKFYLSCTRLYNSSFGYSSKFSNGGARIKLDGDKLAQRFKGKPINYWNGLNDKYHYYQNLPKNHEEFKDSIKWRLGRFKRENPNATDKDIQHFIDYNFNTDAQKHLDNETEDRLLSYEPSITNAHEYILSIDVLLPDLKQKAQFKQLASSLAFKTPLGRYVRIFDSVEEFNKLNGKPVDLNELLDGEFNDTTYSNKNARQSNALAKDALKYVILFISYANHDFEGKKFGQKVSSLLQKYELTKFSNEIGDIFNFTKTWGYTLRNIGEHLDSLRRDLSDRPNRDNSNILKMLTDYLLSIGANSFREGYRMKNDMTDEFYGNKRVYDKIDTEYKRDFLIINRCLIINPEKEMFSDLVRYVLGWTEDDIRYEADSLAYAITDQYSNPYKYNKEKSKNNNSMFQYLHKLFRKGTIGQVIQTIEKLNNSANEEDSLFLRMGLDIENSKMDYWEASRFTTLNVYKYERNTNNYDYMKGVKIRDKDLEKAFPKKRQ